MPKRTDIKSILIIGSGPIIIGQACEFDYSGTQACKSLRAEGYRIILVNSNPATIMTDPELADRTYLEPLTVDVLDQIIAREKPDALLPTLGGQTGLNLASELAESGILAKHQVELIGATWDVIRRAENRLLFKQTLEQAGLDLPRSGYAHSFDDAVQIGKQIGYPLIIRPSFTLGGTGSTIVKTESELKVNVEWGLSLSPVKEVLVEESVIGWKEYELEVMRDNKDNVVIVCTIENFDPMGIHTGDSITVAPAQTLTDKEFQRMRNWSLTVMRAIGVETGGSNIQFAVNPKDGRMVVIEMNPRVSRSSALASKATGFPIAKIAAKLAVGYTLDEIPNDITQKTPACFEPTIDYCVVKVPRFTFEKFTGTDSTLTTSMKSVGETMAIGRTFKEALQKALRGLEIGHHGLDSISPKSIEISDIELRNSLRIPNCDRIFAVKTALHRGFTIEEIYNLSAIDPWFISQIKELVDCETKLSSLGYKNVTKDLLWQAKQYGFADLQLGKLWNVSSDEIRTLRKKNGLLPTYKLVDTCAAEFMAYTPYYYSTYETEDDVPVDKRPRMIILGSGPNRIGQGIEFDYCCVHAAMALRELGYVTIMVNCNPETVSTDYETCDRLYFEPLTIEDVLNIIDKENPTGVIVQFGGQTPLNLALPLAQHNVPIVGTQPQDIDLAEDRGLFGKLLAELKIPQPENGTAFSFTDARTVATRIGYPVMVRPSYVLGGRAMEIVYDESSLSDYLARATAVSPEHPVLIDKFLSDATEIDVDAVCDGTQVYIGGIMEHIEEAGIHSGDSACVLPSFSLSTEIKSTLIEYTEKIARALNVRGLINLQYAVKDRILYVLEANPRASRTVPYVSKATGVPLAKLAAKIIAGKKLADLLPAIDIQVKTNRQHYAVKEVVLPFLRFPGVDTLLGPEMRSTGEVMGIDTEFGLAFAKAEESAGSKLPYDDAGTFFVTVKDEDKPKLLPLAKQLVSLGIKLLATRNTGEYLRRYNVPVELVYKVNEGEPNCVDLIRSGKVNLVINTPSGRRARSDGYAMRRSALESNVPIITTIFAARAVVEGIIARKKKGYTIRSLQEYHHM